MSMTILYSVKESSLESLSWFSLVLFRVFCDLVLLGPWVSVWSSVHFFRYAKIQNIILKLNFIDLLLNLLPIFLFTNNFVLMFILDFTLTHKKIYLFKSFFDDSGVNGKIHFNHSGDCSNFKNVKHFMTYYNWVV